MVDINVTVDLEDWERTGLKWSAATLVIGGLLSVAVHMYQPQWFLPYTAAIGIVVGLGMAMALDNSTEKDGPEDEPLGALAGYVAGLVGIAVLPLGAFTPQSYVAAGATGLTLLIAGAGLMAVFDPGLGEEKDGGDGVPDDPTEILDGGGD